MKNCHSIEPKVGRIINRKWKTATVQFSFKVLEIKLIAHMNILWGLWTTKPSWQQTMAHNQVCGPEFNKHKEVHTSPDATKPRLKDLNDKEHDCSFLCISSQHAYWSRIKSHLKVTMWHTNWKAIFHPHLPHLNTVKLHLQTEPERTTKHNKSWRRIHKNNS